VVRQPYHFKGNSVKENPEPSRRFFPRNVSPGNPCAGISTAQAGR
jgi:hypothetical protein